MGCRDAEMDQFASSQIASVCSVPVEAGTADRILHSLLTLAWYFVGLLSESMQNQRSLVMQLGDANTILTCSCRSCQHVLRVNVFRRPHLQRSSAFWEGSRWADPVTIRSFQARAMMQPHGNSDCSLQATQVLKNPRTPPI